MSSSVKFSYVMMNLALNNSGATFLLIYSMLLLSFSLMIWYVLYAIPDAHGLIMKGKSSLIVDNKGDNNSTLNEDGEDSQ